MTLKVHTLDAETHNSEEVYTLSLVPLTPSKHIYPTVEVLKASVSHCLSHTHPCNSTSCLSL